MALSENLSLLFKIKGDNSDGIRAIKSTENAIQGLAGVARSAGSGDISGLTGSLAGLTSGLGPVGIGVATAAAGITALAAVASTAAVGIWNAAKSAAEYGGKINDLSDKTGLGAKTLSSLDFAAQQAGSSIEGISGAIVKFNRLAGEAANGSAEAAKKLQQFGVTPQQAINDLDGALAKVFKTINDLPAGPAQAKAAFDAFGRSGADLIPVIKQFDGDLEKLKKTATDVGFAIDDKAKKAADEFDDGLKQLNLQVQALWRTFGTEFLPVLTEGMKQISTWFSQNKDSIRGFATESANALRGLWDILKSIWTWTEEHPTLTRILLAGSTFGVSEGVRLMGGSFTALSQYGASLPSTVDNLGANDPSEQIKKMLKMQQLAAEEAERKAEEAQKRAELAVKNRGQLIDATIDQWSTYYQAQQKVIATTFATSDVSKANFDKYLVDIQASMIQARDKMLELTDWKFNLQSFGKSGEELLALQRKHEADRAKIIASSESQIASIKNQAYQDQKARLDASFGLDQQRQTNVFNQQKRELEDALKRRQITYEDYLSRKQKLEEDAASKAILTETSYVDKLIMLWKEYAKTPNLPKVEKDKIETEIKKLEDRLAELKQRFVELGITEGTATEPKGPAGGEPGTGGGGDPGKPAPPTPWEEWATRVVKAIGTVNDSMATMKGMLLDVMQSMENALKSAIVNWLLYGESVGKALKKALAAQLATMAAEAAIWALKATALGFYYLATMQPTLAANAFTSAAYWGAVAVAAGLGARALAKGSFEQQSGKATGQDSTTSRNTSGQGQAYSSQGNQTVNATMGGVSLAPTAEIVIRDASGMFSQLFEAEIKQNSRVRKLIIDTANS